MLLTCVAQMMYTAATTYDDVKDRVVADFGCGCGMLSIAAAILGAKKVYALDIDSDALDICKRNLEDLGIIDLPTDDENVSEDFDIPSELEDEEYEDKEHDSCDCEHDKEHDYRDCEEDKEHESDGRDGDLVELFNGDVLDSDFLIKTLADKDIHTIITNPPFGTKNNAGIDVAFLEAALRLAESNPSLRTIYSMHKTSTRTHLQRKADGWKCQLTVIAEMKFDLPAKYAFHKHDNVAIAVDLLRFKLPSKD